MTENARTPHSGALPNYDKAEIPTRKLVGYLLNPLHLEGRHKGRVFKSALGFEPADSSELAEAILAELPYHSCVTTQAGTWGQKYEVTLPIRGKSGKGADVLTVWIVRPGTSFPSLVTAMVVGKVGD